MAGVAMPPVISALSSILKPPASWWPSRPRSGRPVVKVANRIAFSVLLYPCSALLALRPVGLLFCTLPLGTPRLRDHLGGQTVEEPSVVNRSRVGTRESFAIVDRGSVVTEVKRREG